MKNYPLEVTEWKESEGTLSGWYTKGHHEFGEFYRAVVGLHLGSGGKLPIHVGTARHEWWRTVYDVRANNGTVNFVEAIPGSRGAFPVTTANALSGSEPQRQEFVVVPDRPEANRNFILRFWNRVVSAFQ